MLRPSKQIQTQLKTIDNSNPPTLPRRRACESRVTDHQPTSRKHTPNKPRATGHQPPTYNHKVSKPPNSQPATSITTSTNQPSHQSANTQLRSTTASFRCHTQPVFHRSPVSHMKPPGRQLGPTAHQSQQASEAANLPNSPRPPSTGLRSVAEDIRPPVSDRQPPLRPPALASSPQDTPNPRSKHPLSWKERCALVYLYGSTLYLIES